MFAHAWGHCAQPRRTRGCTLFKHKSRGMADWQGASNGERWHRYKAEVCLGWPLDARNNTLHFSQVLNKSIFYFILVSWGNNSPPHNSELNLAHQYTVMAPVPLTSLSLFFFWSLNLLLWSTMCHIITDIWLNPYSILQCRDLIIFIVHTSACHIWDLLCLRLGAGQQLGPA